MKKLSRQQKRMAKLIGLDKPRLPSVDRTIVLEGRTYKVCAFADPFDHQRRIFQAWVPSSITGNHQTVTSFGEGRWWGLVGTERDPERYEHLPHFSKERSAACRAQKADRAREARRAIVASFPEVEDWVAEGLSESTLLSSHEIVSRVRLPEDKEAR